MTVDALTLELGALVESATNLPTSIDPVRPPSVPGCFVGPPSITPDGETGGRLLVAQWEIGAVVPATTGAWSSAATLGEQISAAVIDHATLGLVGARSVLYPAGDSELPGYRIDVAVLLHAQALEDLSAGARLSALAVLTVTALVVPANVVDATATLAALAVLSAAGTVVGAPVVDGAATLLSPGVLTASAVVIPAPATIDGAATLTAAGVLTAAGIVVLPGAVPPVAGYTLWLDASDPATITAAGGSVSQWANKAGGAPWVQPTAGAQPLTGSTSLNGRNTIWFPDDRLMTVSTNPLAGATAATLFVVCKNSGANTSGPIILGPTADDFWLFGGQFYSSFGSTVRHDAIPATGVVTTGGYMVSNTAAAGPWQLWANGVSMRADTGNTVAWLTGGKLGRNDASAPFLGDIAEIVAYPSALNTTDRQAVETYLRDKWWTPGGLPGLVGWWDASDTATITSSAGKVSQWLSKAPGAYALVQGTAALQPTTGTHTQNGRNTIYFNGGNQIDNGGGIITTPCTIAAAFQQDGAAGAVNMVFVGSEAIIGTDAGGGWTFHAGTQLQTMVWSDLLSPHTHVVKFKNDATSSYWLDDVMKATGNVGSGFGNHNLILQGYTQHRFFELVIVQGEMSAANTTAFRNYCRAKWGTV